LFKKSMAFTMPSFSVPNIPKSSRHLSRPRSNSPTWSNPHPGPARHGRRDAWPRRKGPLRPRNAAVAAPSSPHPLLASSHGGRSGTSSMRQRRQHVGSEYPTLPAGAASAGFARGSPSSAAVLSAAPHHAQGHLQAL
jgi:hypothetical protein